MNESHTRNFDEVLQAERERIDAQRGVRGIGAGPLVGLALSGGGLRATFFGLGVLQALERHGLLSRVDYLSSVAGGGYIASALTWFRREGAVRFPFGTRGIGIRSARPGEPDEPSSILAFLRQHGEHLTPAGGTQESELPPPRRLDDARSAVPPITYASLVARAVFLSVFVYGSLAVLLFLVLQVLDRAVLLVAPVLAGAYPTPTWIAAVTHLNFALLLSVAVLAVLAVGWVAHPLVAYGLRRRARKQPSSQSRNRAYSLGLWSQRWAGRLLGTALVTGAFGSVPLTVGWLDGYLPDRWSIGLLASAGIAAGALLGVAVFRQQRREGGSSTSSRLLRDVRESSAAFLMLYGLLTVSYVTAAGLLNSAALKLGLGVMAVAVVVALLSDLNQLNISRTFRDRLMEAFLPDHGAIERNQWRPALEANIATLADLCGADTPGPYHLLDATLVTVSSRRARFRSRGGDSFVLSPLWVGGDATGWRRTSDWLEGRLTLATAMAISGPTARPPLGPDGPDSARKRVASGSLFALGLYLGYWARNPDPLFSRYYHVPNYRDPGLVRGILGRGRHEHGRFVELSDGSSFDALGLYELIRRRLPVIVVADATEDAGYRFEALANAATRVRTDFGVEIDFPIPALDLDGLVPDPADGPRASVARGFAVGTIRYPNAKGAHESTGVLIYLKATPLDDMPPEVVGYRGSHPDFPHEHTGESLFGEERVEAYRELGYQVAAALSIANLERERPEIDGKPWL